MSEERTQYNVHPDVLVRLETSEKYIKHLESTNDGLTMVMGRHRETMREQAERIAELDKANAEMSERISYLNTIGSVFRTTVKDQSDTITAQQERIAELEATVLRQMETIARLEQDNRRLRHLDAMPVDAMRAVAVSCEVYTDDLITVCDWFEKHDGVQ